MPGTVILVEDDAALRLATVQALELADVPVRAFAGAAAALQALDAAFDGVVVSDIRMPRIDGFELLARVRGLDPELPVILVTGHGDVPMAVAAVKEGAYDFLTKPFGVEQLLATVRRGLERRALVIENRALRAAADGGAADGPLIGASAAMTRLRRAVRQLAEADVDVLIEGESGTGKDLAALLLHRLGRRRDRPLVAIDCAALPAGHAELDLFGHAANSVAHTRQARAGQVAASDGGTLLLDGVDALPLGVQGALLRTLEEREVRPVGSERAEAVNLRVVATSATPLADAVAAGVFRADLFHRLALTRLVLPPLRDREGDRLVLFARFVDEACVSLRREAVEIGAAERAHVMRHDWPGNVRELRNYAYDVALGCGRADGEAGGGDLRTRTAAFEAAMIADALRQTGGHVVRALAILQVPRKTLYEKMARYGIDPAAFR